MRIFVDTTLLVDVDRGDPGAIDLCRRVTAHHEAMVSTVTVTEILTGSYLRRDYRRAAHRARAVLDQFTWVDVTGEVADTAARLLAFLIQRGQEAGFQDALIGASAHTERAEMLVTDNTRDFRKFPVLRGKVVTPAEAQKRLDTTA